MLTMRRNQMTKISDRHIRAGANRHSVGAARAMHSSKSRSMREALPRITDEPVGAPVQVERKQISLPDP